MANHPHKLPRDHYVGRRKHFLTACTYFRRELFRDPVLAAMATQHLLRACRKHGFVVIAYTLMPDHVHVLVEGVREDSDFLKWLELWRQLSGFWMMQQAREPLWQEGYWDYTLRDDDRMAGLASYIVRNPVVAGLVATPEEYPYSGSERFSITEMAAADSTKPRLGDL